LGYTATNLETHYITGEWIPCYDNSTLGTICSLYMDENGSPDAKFILVFDLTFQGLEDACMLNKLGTFKLSCHCCDVLWHAYSLVWSFLVSLEQLSLFHTTVLPKKLRSTDFVHSTNLM
jgi:hypothetical protein